MRPETPPPAGPGTLTALLEEVFREGGPARSTWVDELAAGTVLGRYDLVREIGRGGMGVVWEARDRELGRRVAVKVIRPRGGRAPEKRALEEAEIAARLSHPGIVTVLDVGRSEGNAWIVQEYLEGETVAERLARGPLPLREALSIGLGAARALAHAHAHGVVHRDLTARNLFLCADGHVKLLDLGMAQAFGRRRLAGGSVDAMAPEQAAGAPEDERTDVYALGALLFQMLTGKPAVEGDRPGATARGLSTPEAPALGTLVESMLARDPLARPRDAAAVVRALEEIQSGLPREAGSVAGRSRVRAPARTRWVLAGAAVAAVVLGAPLAGWLVLRRPPPPANVVYAASSAFTACQWMVVSYDDLESAPAGSIQRNGKVNGQEPARRDGRLVWLQRSDWNILAVPLKERPDVFAVDATVFLPAPKDGIRSAALTVPSDPEGPDPGNLAHGRSLGVSQEPTGGPRFRWGFTGGPGRTVSLFAGPLPHPITDGWHKLRIEGSRRDCWVRALIDGQPIAIETGVCDLDGGHVVLQGTTGYWDAADVAWKDLHLFRGEAGCR